MSPMEQLAKQEYERGYSDGKSDYFAAGVAEGEMRARQRMIANRVVANQHPFAASGKVIAEPVKQEPVADESPRFETEDHDLTTLLELTVDIYSGICNHDTAVWWHETLGKVEAKLTPVERQWVDLTDEEIYKCRSDYGEYETCRSVIAKFKEKNK